MSNIVSSNTDLDIKIDNIFKRYPGRHSNAINGVSLDINQGEFVAILGPSGCGKSTLLNLIAGIDRPDKGCIKLSDKNLDNMTDHELTLIRRHDIGFVFQFFNLLPTFNVMENISLPLEISGLAKESSSVDSLVEYIGLSDKVASLPAQLSGGEMQRTAIARAIIHDPKIVLADEPTGNLDTENGTKILDLLRQINQSNKMTVVMATHSHEASQYADRIIKMRDGKVESNE